MSRLLVDDVTKTDARALLNVNKMATISDIVAPSNEYIYASGANELTVVEGCVIAVGGAGIFKTANTILTAANLDAGSAFAVGKDYYVYICDSRIDSADEKYVISLNSTYPTGWNATNSRKIGGFHYGRCRKVDSNLQPLNGSSVIFGTGWESAVSNGIVPRSVWTLGHRPKCSPEGMVYLGGGTWVDIYLNSDDGAKGLKSEYGCAPMTGTESMNWYNFVERLAKSGKRLPNYAEFCAYAFGSPAGLDNANTNAWSATSNTGRGVTGSVVNAVSSVGVVDAVGRVWEWLDELITRAEHATNADYHASVAWGCRNANSIGIEMCVRKKNTKSMGATDKDWYFEDATVEAAAELTRYLMNKYGVPASHVIRHYDVTGKICPNPYVYNTSAHTWDEFKRKISGQAETPQGGNEKTIWNFLTGKGLNAYAVAGIMGNLYAESGLMPNNLQNTYNNKLGKTDAEYTAAVDNGSYGNFVKDSAGYGLAQWTYLSRKQALLNHAKQAGVSIADLNMQLGFLWEELQGYTAVMDALKKAGSVRAASDAVLTGYEKPADQSETVKKKRAEYGEGYYKKYAAGNGTKYYRVRKSWTDAASQLGAFTSLENAKSACKAGYTVYDDNGKAVYTAAGQQASAGVPFSVQVDILDLNIRTGAGTNYAKTGETTGKGVFTIVEVKAGQGASAGWGRLKSGAGWISLDYATRLA